MPDEPRLSNRCGLSNIGRGCWVHRFVSGRYDARIYLLPLHLHESNNLLSYSSFIHKRFLNVNSDIIMTETNATKEPKRLIGRRRQRPENPIETANKISDEEFLNQYVKTR